ncbi:hypothetical protein Rs2_27810 [Raphanus sativus]|uniref:Uncharacterized protein LOC130495937 n=1 Tax=Raphanus sativus TaxID=3726 RepID=A0A9W3BWA3_RAPSA|nr:uncharacterized protein LOC130495937 [Raphanus sativus]KAJ4888062.1 hypothetical protein Rs2_27810 [Raphanus sativus]
MDKPSESGSVIKHGCLNLDSYLSFNGRVEIDISTQFESVRERRLIGSEVLVSGNLLIIKNPKQPLRERDSLYEKMGYFDSARVTVESGAGPSPPPQSLVVRITSNRNCAGPPPPLTLVAGS